MWLALAAGASSPGRVSSDAFSGDAPEVSESKHKVLVVEDELHLREFWVWWDRYMNAPSPRGSSTKGGAVEHEGGGEGRL